MPRRPSPEIRRALIERAAELLARREPVTTRALVAGTGASTMAVYTYFGGMDGLWRAVRQEGFSRLAARMAEVEPSSDPVRDMVRLSAAFFVNALDQPDLYRVMFDAEVDLSDPAAAAASFELLVDAARRAIAEGRFDRRTDPVDLITRWWAFGHGLLSLVVAGVLPVEAVDRHLVPTATALLVAVGDDPARCARSVKAGWRSFSVPDGRGRSGSG